MFHELAFLTFLIVTTLRVALVHGICRGPTLVMVGLTLVPLGVRNWCCRKTTAVALRWRLLAYLPLMALVYFVLGWVVPLLHEGGAAWLQRSDDWLIGGNASVWLSFYASAWLTDCFSFFYLAFFGYLAWAMWHYGREPLAILTEFIRGLFTVYALGFMGYTFISAAGPYLELREQFPEDLTGGWMKAIYDRTILTGTNRTDCFPCLHVAVSLFILLFDRRHSRKRFRWALLPCFLIWVSTLYLRQHYFTDLVAGVVLSVFALWIARSRAQETGNDISFLDTCSKKID